MSSLSFVHRYFDWGGRNGFGIGWGGRFRDWGQLTPNKYVKKALISRQSQG